MNRLYVVEPMPTPTGSKADHRLPLRAADIELFAGALSTAVGTGRGPTEGENQEIYNWVGPVARDLLNHKGASLVIAGERGLDFTLVISLLLMLALLSMYAVPLSRNVMVHAGIYTAYFLAGSLGMILRTTFGLKNVVELDTALMSVSCGCVLAWLFLLSPQGEETKVRQPWLGSDQEARILQHLDALNAALLKSAKK
jgi:hypothetical protein